MGMCVRAHARSIKVYTCIIYTRSAIMIILFIVQLEFYFGDANLPRDKFLKGKMAEHPEGCKSNLC